MRWRESAAASLGECAGRIADPTNAADQPAFSVSLATAYPVKLTGQIVATFAADA
jgi:hypothetical protein